MDAPVDAVIREARADDGDALARIWTENARYYAERFPDDFRLPDQDGLAELLASPTDDDSVTFVAEADGEVGAFAYARMIRPDAAARWQYMASAVETRARVEALGTGDAFQRRGLATALVDACEAWARERGAVQVQTTTYLGSDVSVPFWTERMGYRRSGVVLVKRL